jgi:hypothetical protein
VATLHVLELAHLAQLAPPQSTSVSVPSLTALLQVVFWQIPL